VVCGSYGLKKREMMARKSAKKNLRHIKLLLLDVDGVMTDGGITYSSSGEELKRFNTKDGYGIVKFQRAGLKVGIITGRVSTIVERRAEELGITEVYQNFENKREAYESIKKKFHLTDTQIAFIGDDEIDVAVLKCVGFSAAPSDAVPLVKKHVHYICTRSGGNGAVREVIDMILQHQK
jgi:3-deoxy-D-manno-octulosonate 8-phosphate phosphatase (KDO 8-P phosphatase)